MTPPFLFVALLIFGRAPIQVYHENVLKWILRFKTDLHDGDRTEQLPQLLNQFLDLVPHGILHPQRSLASNGHPHTLSAFT
jgi:hypothetical protein